MENTRKKENQLNFAFKDNAFSPDDASRGILLFLIFETAVSLVYQTVYSMGATATFLSYFFNVLLDVCFVLCVFIIAKNRRNRAINELRIKKAPSFLQIVLCLGISLICIFGFSSLTNCFLQLLYNMGYSSIASDIVIADFGSYILYTVLVCVLPALCEEILFRGLIFSGLKKISPSVGVLGSAFLFMIMHGSPDQTVHQFILGVILALAFLITNNLWVPIVIHFFNNFIAVTYAYLINGDSSSTDVEVVEIYLSQYFMYALITSIIAGCLVYLIFKILSNLNETKNVNKTFDNNMNRGTIGAEVGYRVIDETASEFSFSQAGPIEFEEKGNVYANPDMVSTNSLLSDPNKMTKQGRFIMTISVIWLSLDWLLALITGFIL